MARGVVAGGVVVGGVVAEGVVVGLVVGHCDLLRFVFGPLVDTDTYVVFSGCIATPNHTSHTATTPATTFQPPSPAPASSHPQPPPSTSPASRPAVAGGVLVGWRVAGVADSDVGGVAGGGMLRCSAVRTGSIGLVHQRYKRFG